LNYEFVRLLLRLAGGAEQKSHSKVRMDRNGMMVEATTHSHVIAQQGSDGPNDGYGEGKRDGAAYPL